MVQSPKTPESWKYEKITNKIPHPRLPPQNTKKIPEKCKNSNFWAILYFSVIFFVFSVGNLRWGILYFFRNLFVFPGFRGFWALYHPRGIVRLRAIKGCFRPLFAPICPPRPSHCADELRLIKTYQGLEGL